MSFIDGFSSYVYIGLKQLGLAFIIYRPHSDFFFDEAVDIHC